MSSVPLPPVLLALSPAAVVPDAAAPPGPTWLFTTLSAAASSSSSAGTGAPTYETDKCAEQLRCGLSEDPHILSGKLPASQGCTENAPARSMQ